MPRKFKRITNASMQLKRKNPGLSKTQAKTVRKIAKKTVMGLAETKVFGQQEENVQLFHNKPLYISNLLSCKQGVKDDNGLVDRDARIGDEIQLTNANIKFWLSNKLDRPNCMYRLIMFWYDSTVTLADAIYIYLYIFFASGYTKKILKMFIHATGALEASVR